MKKVTPKTKMVKTAKGKKPVKVQVAPAKGRAHSNKYD